MMKNYKSLAARLPVALASLVMLACGLSAAEEKLEPVLTLRGHTMRLSAVAYSADGKRIVSAGADRRVMVWDAVDGKKELTLHGHSDWVMGLAYSPRGEYVASADIDGQVNVWDPRTGKVICSLKTRDSARQLSYERARLACSPDGKRLALAVVQMSAVTGVEEPVRVWETATGQEVLALKGQPLGASAVAFSPDGRRLFTGYMFGSARLWEVATGRESLALKGHADTINGAAYHPSGRRLATASEDETVKVWDTGTGEELLTLKGHVGPVLGVTFSPDAKLLASTSRGNRAQGVRGELRIWDADKGQVKVSIKEPREGMNDLAFSPDGKYLAVACEGSTVKVWDVAKLVEK